MKEIKESHTAKFELNIRRNNIVEDSFFQIKRIKSEETRKLRKNLWINYVGEKGDDFGGVARDWFHNLSTELFNPYYGLFEYSANDVYTLQINPDSGLCNDKHLELFHFIGRIIGMAIFHKKLINAFFIRPFYTMMLGMINPILNENLILNILGKKITLDDLQFVDEFYYNSLNHILENDPSDYGMSFQVSFDSFGETVCENLVDNGEAIPVTEENKMEYIDKVVQWRFVKRVKVNLYLKKL